MGVADTLRVIERASVASGVVTNDEFRTLLDTYTAMQRKRDPLAAIGAYFRRPTDRHTGCSPPPLPSCAHALPNPPTTHTTHKLGGSRCYQCEWPPWLLRTSTTKTFW